MKLEDRKRKLTNKRRLKKLNQQFIQEYEDNVDDFILYNKRPSLKEQVEKYILMVSPFMIHGLFTHSTIVARDSNILTQQTINQNIENTIMEYKEHVTDCLVNAENTLSDLSVDTKAYEDFRKGGLGVTESLQLSTPKGNEPIAPASPQLFHGSIENKMLQMEATDEFYGYTSLSDDDGNPLVVGKMWVWSELENTRHENMDKLTIPVDDVFVVYNEVTGEEDLGYYPRDPSMSAGNIVNCACSLLYLDEFGEEVTI